jgi:hypothetical protein
MILQALFKGWAAGFLGMAVVFFGMFFLFSIAGGDEVLVVLILTGVVAAVLGFFAAWNTTKSRL